MLDVQGRSLPDIIQAYSKYSHAPDPVLGPVHNALLLLYISLAHIVQDQDCSTLRSRTLTDYLPFPLCLSHPEMLLLLSCTEVHHRLNNNIPYKRVIPHVSDQYEEPSHS